MPVAATGTDVLPELVAGERPPDDAWHPVDMLAGARIVIDDAPRSDGWLASSSVQEKDYRAFRAVFPDHELILTTADGLTYAGLDVDVLLSGMGNHIVRVKLGTDTQVLGSGGGPVAWSPHDLEQAVRAKLADSERRFA
mgnify:CR=1 FL=1